MGFAVKVNAVVIRGANDAETEDFVAFSAAHGIPVRFLEYMKIGPERAQHERLFVPAAETMARIAERHTLTPHRRPKSDATAFSFRTETRSRDRLHRVREPPVLRDVLPPAAVAARDAPSVPDVRGRPRASSACRATSIRPCSQPCSR